MKQRLANYAQLIKMRLSLLVVGNPSSCRYADDLVIIRWRIFYYRLFQYF